MAPVIFIISYWIYDEELAGSEYQALFCKTCLLIQFYPQETVNIESVWARKPNTLLFYTKRLRLILEACPRTYYNLRKTGQVPFFPLEASA